MEEVLQLVNAGLLYENIKDKSFRWWKRKRKSIYETGAENMNKICDCY